MSDELFRVMPPPRLDVQVVTPQLDPEVAQLPETSLRPEDVTAVDAYFGQDRESRTVADLMSLYVSGRLLVDLAQEHLQPSVVEEEQQVKKAEAPRKE
jgi:hypothetical protein